MNNFDLNDIEKHSVDFTVENYSRLLRLAKKNYRFTDYLSVDSLEGCVLWRHDVDLSLNRACKIAQIEYEEGVKSTYFLNPHSEFYNLFEKQQFELIKRILSYGHDIGLHFDALFYSMDSEDQLDALVQKEAKLLQDHFGVPVHAVSFHNPDNFTLSCEKDSYGGLVNCYSKYFKTQVPYCSDSNGYWRHRRMYDVLADAVDPCLQVLTHPGLWQEARMAPRERVFRCVFGRASANCDSYDQVLDTHGRENVAGQPGYLRFFRDLDKQKYHLYDYLWNRGHLEILLIELYRLGQIQIFRVCWHAIENAYGIKGSELALYINPNLFDLKAIELFELLFKDNWATVCGSSVKIHAAYISVCNSVFTKREAIDSDKVEACCIYFCNIIKSLAEWAISMKAIGTDGISSSKPCSDRAIGNTNLMNFEQWTDLQAQLRVLFKV